MIDWKLILRRLHSLPDYEHELRPPCLPRLIAEVESRLGNLPPDVKGMLPLFNGGKLFVNPMPSVTIFGLSLPDDSPGFDWFIDRYTPAWRSAKNRASDWVLAMTSYGGLLIMDEALNVRQWDTSRHAWEGSSLTYETWLDDALTECEISVEELKQDKKQRNRE